MMITAIASDAPLVAVGLTDYRNRLAGERGLMPDNVPPAAGNGSVGDEAPFYPQGRDLAPPPPQPETDRSTIFAAAVIAGALSPTPQTMDELIMRIGNSTIPAESEARLKDLLA